MRTNLLAGAMAPVLIVACTVGVASGSPIAGQPAAAACSGPSFTTVGAGGTPAFKSMHMEVQGITGKPSRGQIVVASGTYPLKMYNSFATADNVKATSAIKAGSRIPVTVRLTNACKTTTRAVTAVFK